VCVFVCVCVRVCVFWCGVREGVFDMMFGIALVGNILYTCIYDVQLRCT